MSDDKAEGARNEVKRILSAGVIREVKYPEWPTNGEVEVPSAIGDTTNAVVELRESVRP